VVAPPIAPIEPAPEVNNPAEKPASPLRLRIDPVSPPPAPKSAAPKPPAAKSPAAKSPDAKPPVLPLPPPGTLQASLIPTPEPKAKPLLPIFQMLFSGEAKFVRPWRVRVRK
jgi:hypothetical protein